MSKYDESLIRVRFIGDDLENRSIPIYELGLSLIAIQRLVHKAFLLKAKRLTHSNFPSKGERIRLALQLSGRKRASDGYAFDPVYPQISDSRGLQEITDIMLRNVAAYASVRDFERFKTLDDDRRLYVINVYNQISDLATRIGNIGGIESIEVSTSASSNVPAVHITSETVDLVRTVKGKLMQGLRSTITGTVTDLMPNTKNIRLMTQEFPRQITVRLSASDFDKIRYSAYQSLFLQITGWPMHKMGVESLKYEVFEADGIEFLPSLF